MKKYYIIGSIIAVLIFIIMFSIVEIAACSSANACKALVSDLENNSVVLRYYMDDDYNNAEVGYVIVLDKKNYRIEILPSKEGYQFIGLYDGPDYNTSTIYVDGNGYGIETLSTDILLYPRFLEV